jgi:hypothetical protein
MSEQMYLQLAARAIQNVGENYTWIPVGESGGVYIRNDKMSEFEQLGKKNLFKKFVTAQKKLALAPIRRSFRTLVAINVHGLATKFKKTLSTPSGEKAVRDKWEKAGGKYSELLKTINAGAKRKKIFDGSLEEDSMMLANCAAEWPHFMRKLTQWLQHYKVTHLREEGITLSEVETLGVVQLAAVLAAALPLIKTFSSVFKHHNAEGGSAEAGGTPIDNIVEQAKDAAVKAGVPHDMIDSDPTDPKHSEKYEKDAGKDDEPKKDSGKIFGLPAPLVYAGGAGIALFVLPKMFHR